MIRALLLALALSLLTACASRAPWGVGDGAPPVPLDPNRIADAIPRDEPRSRYGNPASYEVAGRRYYVLASAEGFTERGIASWYGTKFHGKRTSSGEPYDMYAMTAAHRQLPLPTYARVTNLENGRSVIVRINDRGPFVANRVIDLSYAAAVRLGMVEKGTAPVLIEAISTKGEASKREAVRPGTVTAAAIEYYVQVGAFTEAANAERLLRQLAPTRLGYPASIRQANLPQGTFHRVWVGPIASVEEVDRAFAQLERLGYRDTHVVVQTRAP